MAASALLINEAPILLRDRAVGRLREAIITGHFKPGDRLIERELCEAMGVSRTSIREVLRRLEAEALVEVEPRRGPIVARLSVKQVSEIYEVRALLESAAIRSFTERATERDVERLVRLHEGLKAARRSKDVKRIIELTTAFTAHVLNVVGNELLNDMHAKLLARISLLRAVAIAQPGRLARSEEELDAVMAAITSRAAREASDLFAAYVLNAGKAALEQLG